MEFSSLNEIRRKFGPKGIEDFAEAPGGIGAITDDTQMTLFTTEGLLHARSAGAFKHHEACISYVHSAYLRWLATQGGLQGEQLSTVRSGGGLVNIPDLNVRRAPGNTCISALTTCSVGTIDSPLNDSKGCGGVMRVAPVGLLYASLMNGSGYEKGLGDSFELGCRLAAITHGHPSGYLSAGAFAAIIFGISRGKTLMESIRDARSVLVQWPGHEECLELLDLAVILKESSAASSPESIAMIGEGWTGEEALAIGVYSALAAEGDFSKGVRLAVNHDGDSDSTGSITGNILGLLLGKESIPDGWRERVELKDLIERSGQLLAIAE
ncbi:[Protein ADP-ribosylarginine] hydrolase [Geobacter sp. OR-1]|nr:[Protein ADP-ribosylarginine] hydrolase [Geobacter sp. OR-1]